MNVPLLHFGSLSLAACLALSGCVSQAPVAIAPATLAASTSSTAKPVKCKIAVRRITDERSAPQLVGIVGGRSVPSPADVPAWLSSVLSRLSAHGIAADFSGAESAPGMTYNAALMSAWASHVTTNLTAAVVLKMEAVDPDGKIVQRNYRGQAVRINWDSGDEGINKTIDEAFDEALAKMAPDILANCGASGA